MKSVKHLLCVLMDGIKDAEMWITFASDADEEGKPEWAAWFRQHAKKRTEALDSIYSYVSDEIGLEEKVKAGNELAYALKDHIEDQIDDLHSKLNAL